MAQRGALVAATCTARPADLHGSTRPPLLPLHPAFQDLATGEWVVDSGVVCDFLEAQFPEPALGTVEASPQM